MSIKDIASAKLPEMIDNRRYMHMHPELSFKEKETYKFILNHLSKYPDLHIRENVGANKENEGVGIIASIGEGHPHIAIRADFDALPIEDQKEVAYKSQNPGVMHACGHDGHTSTLLGLVDTVVANKANLKGTVSFIFQYGEEEQPGGAKAMTEDGALNGVDKVYGQHYWSQFDTNEIQARPGALIASPDGFYITIKGSGGHAAYPDTTVDPIVIAAELITNLQTAVSRQISPIDNAVVTVGSVKGGDAFNVIPDSVRIVGTVRTFKQEVKEKIHEIFKKEVEYTTKKRGASYDMDYRYGYPAVVNHEEEAKVIETAALELGLPYKEADPLMIGEDFSHYILEKPGAFFYTGTGNQDKNTRHAHHTDMFDLDEDGMESALMMFMKILELESVIEWK